MEIRKPEITGNILGPVVAIGVVGLGTALVLSGRGGSEQAAYVEQTTSSIPVTSEVPAGLTVSTVETTLPSEARPSPTRPVTTVAPNPGMAPAQAEIPQVPNRPTPTVPHPTVPPTVLGSPNAKPTITFDYLDGNSKVIMVYPGSGESGADRTYNGTYFDDQTVAVDCKTTGREVWPAAGETKIPSSRLWFRISPVPQDSTIRYATDIYANANVPLAQIPDCPAA